MYLRTCVSEKHVTERGSRREVRVEQNGHDKKTLIFFFVFPVSSRKFGKQYLRVRGAKSFFFDNTAFLYQNKNPVSHLGHGRQF
jgi:hypothetical protein